MNSAAVGNIEDFLETPLWVQIWDQKIQHIVVFSIFLLTIILIMVLKDRLSKRKNILNILRYGVLLTSFVYVGLILKAQPTTTNIIIIINSLKGLQFPIGLFLLEPYIFLSFIFIFLTLFLWGRGVFCGWLCPYGAMIELLNKLFNKFHQRLFPELRLSIPDKIHNKLIYLKYVIFVLIVSVSFLSFMLSEYLTEIEPFRTFVLKFNREWYFLLYFIILTVGSMVIYRAFCRYLCPLGAALAIPSLLKKIPFIKMKRYDFCRSCKICTRGCTAQAITSNGSINSGECLNCLDCQVNFWDKNTCPVLIKSQGQAGRP